MHENRRGWPGDSNTLRRRSIVATQTGDPNDYFLVKQQEFTIIRKGKVMLEAIRDASMTVVGT
jgi:hypothetical protein